MREKVEGRVMVKCGIMKSKRKGRRKAKKENKKIERLEKK
jgi:hypothetical protein